MALQSQDVLPKDSKISPSSKVPICSEPQITGTNGLTSVSVPWEVTEQFLNQRHLRYTAVVLTGETSAELRAQQVNGHFLPQRETSDK